MIDQGVLQKLVRLARGARPRVLDLFAGCGGLSLGFQAAGFDIVGAVEHDPDAAASHGANFHPDDPRHATAWDITDLNPKDLATELGLGPVTSGIDVIVGGPPCQAFARVGRSKLREVAEHPEAFKKDQRAQRYLEYLHYVEAFRPLALLMENVPDMLNHSGQNIAEEICEVLEGKGYIARYTLLNAAYYGVPQMRERMFLIAYRKELIDRIAFPMPTHWVKLPPGYSGSRQVALKLLTGRDLLNGDDLFGRAHCYVDPPEATPELLPAVTAEQAIHDLPAITLHLNGLLRRGVRRFDEIMPYDPRRIPTEYGRLMREWPGFENETGLRDHVIRYLPRDWKLFARMQPGDQYPEAYAHAVAMFEERLIELRAQKQSPRKGSAGYKRLWKEFVPPYDAGKFPNKWRKMEADFPARTLMAHLGKDGYSHIHYDNAQGRTISVREAARLQSFPDGFVFCGTMNPAFRQIGNAVPPLMAKAIAEVIGEALYKAVRNVLDEPIEVVAAV